MTAISNPKEQQEHSEFLTFTLGTEQYGVDILKVKEIRGWENLREIHDVPAYIKGVLDFRGVIIPIIDLRIRFEVTDYRYSPTTVIIVLSTENDDKMMGVVVDAVSDVLSVKADQIKPAPDLGSRINTDYVIGMYSEDGVMLMLLDTEKLISPDQLELG